MKYLSSILLTFITSCLLAQNPTYEQTVDFIKTNCVGRMLYKGALDSYERETGHKLTRVDIQNDGRVKLVADQQNGRHDFEIVFNIFDLKSSIDYPDGIRAYKFLVHFQGLNVTSGYGITFATDADAKRVARAFRHLKTMCSKDGGLFDSPTQTEKKPTLSKDETISYIQKLLDEQPVLTAKEKNDTKKYEVTFRNGFIKTHLSTLSKDEDDYIYTERKTEFNFYNGALPTEIKLKEPGSYYYDDIGMNSFYGLTLDYKPSAPYFWQIRETDIGHYKNMTTPTQAENSCKNQSWRNFNNGRINSVDIFIKNESDAKRLKKAFEHLINLMKEENQSEQDNDPFGG